MQNIRITLSYDGTSYHGFQIQKNAVTIQETVQKALSKITGGEVKLVGCGRTDSGVHARAYTANFLTESTIPADKVCPALNANLPDDILCISSCAADMDFHAKNSAIRKKYTYKILNSAAADPFLRNYAWHYKFPLDIEKMQKAARAFIGTHDFIGFAAAGFTVKTTVRTIYSLDVYREGDMIVMDVVGNGFLYNMVRIIAGTLVFAGGGKINPDNMADIIASCDRNRAGITAPPQGLYLTEVMYE